MSSASQKLDEIQVLRAVAAGLVAFGHCLDWSGGARTSSIPPLEWGALGACGVDLFFVISGFIIARSVWGAPQQPAAHRFLLRRGLRILPSYWFWSALYAASLLLRSQELPDGALAKTLLFFSFSDQALYAVPLLFVGWTLSYELLFYFSIGLSLRLDLARPPLLFGLALGLALLSFASTGAPVWLRFLANPLWLEFASGILLFLCLDKLQRLPRSLGLLGLLAGLLLLGLSLPHAAALADIQQTVDGTSTWLRVALWGSAALLIVAGTLINGPLFRRLPALFSKLGDASYSWYLTQLLVIPVTAVCWRRVWPGAPWPCFALFGLITTALTAWIAYRWLELPLNRRLARALGLTKVS